jgi:ligand-binding SRPBCC domain-containing protein
MPYLLTTRAAVPLDVERVFDFFADANNLERLSPPWLRLRVEAPAPTLAPGARVDYQMRLGRLGMRCQIEITEWDPPQRFVDELRRGPYRWWIHTHTFTSGPDGTVMEDVVDYQPAGGSLGSKLAHEVFVARTLRAIFTYRSIALRDAFGLEREETPPAVIIVRR